MPLFNLECECGKVIIDKLCSHFKAQETVCPDCGAIMRIAPVKNGGFKIFGFSADNGYHREEISYDGNPNPQW